MQEYLIENRFPAMMNNSYLAGFMDADGSIMLLKSKNPTESNLYYRLVAQVTNRDLRILNVLQVRFGGKITLLDNHKINSNWQKVYRWRAHGNNALKFLLKVKPYLELKREQAELGIKFQKEKDERTKKWRTETQKASEFMVYNRFRELNQRGSSLFA